MTDVPPNFDNLALCLHLLFPLSMSSETHLLGTHQLRFDRSKLIDLPGYWSSDLQEIAEIKLPDLNCTSMEAAMRIVEGTAKNMGITVDAAVAAT